MTPHSTVALTLASLLLFAPVALAATPDTGTTPAQPWRAQGFALIELDKLDEAEKKFRGAMKIDANDKVSPNELEYIKQLRAKNR